MHLFEIPDTIMSDPTDDVSVAFSTWPQLAPGLLGIRLHGGKIIGAEYWQKGSYYTFYYKALTEET